MAAAIFLLLMQPIFVQGSGNMWTQAGYTWAGPSSCYEAGFLLQKTSDAIDQGAWEAGLHCPESGPNPTGCMEWSGKNPDIGACEMFSWPGALAAPVNLEVN